MRFCFIDAETACYPIRILCRSLEVSRSGYYAWRGRAASARAQEDARLKVKFAAWHRASHGTYGSPRIDVRRRHSSLDYMSPVELEPKHPNHGGFAPMVGVLDQEEWRRERPGATA